MIKMAAVGMEASAFQLKESIDCLFTLEHESKLAQPAWKK